MTRVLIVDDSPIIRNFLQKVLERDPEIEVVGAAPDPFVAKDLILQVQPDVVTLDLQMPRMDGLTFLRKLSRYYPIPVVVVSSLTAAAGAVALEALAAGACDVVGKPGIGYSREQMAADLIAKVKVAARANRRRLMPPAPEESAAPGPALAPRQPLAMPAQFNARAASRILAIGASTGGTIALESVLKNLPATTSPTLIVQHMPEVFTASFAGRLNQLVPMEVREARDGEALAQGVALIAPGNRHLSLRQNGGRYFAHVSDGPPVNRHRPSVDVLFDSVAEVAGRSAVGAILTGMGADGAQGLLKMRQAGARTVAQDEASCVVFGMPKAAIDLGGAEEIASLEQIPHWLTHKLSVG